jgi:hypothetical protein
MCAWVNPGSMEGGDGAAFGALTIVPTMPRSSHSVAFFPRLFRFRDRNYIANDLVARYDGEAVSEDSCLYHGV